MKRCGLILSGLLLATVALSGSVPPAAEVQDQQRPNIVFMFPDNLG